MARSTTELFKPLRLLMLLRRALLFGNLDDDRHRCQHGDASLETLGSLLTLGGKVELTVVPYGVAVLAPLRVEHVPGEIVRAGAGGDHLVQFGPRLCRRYRWQRQNSYQQSCAG